MNKILRFTLMNPRTVLTAFAALTVYATGATTVAYVNNERANRFAAAAVSYQATVEAQTEAAKAIAQAGELRAQTADKAIAIAREAGKADRRAAEVYLNLPVPAPEVRCDAASALVDEALRESRK